MTPIQEQAIKQVQELRNKYCKNSHLVNLIFELGNDFVNAKLECNHPNPNEAVESARKSIVDNLNSGGKPVAVLVNSLGAPFPQLEIYPEFENDAGFCHKLTQYANSL